MPQVTFNQNNDQPNPSNNNSNMSNPNNTPNWKPEEVPQLTVDVYRKGDSIFVVSTVAGISHSDLDISIENNTLSIKGFRNKPYDSKEIESLLEECVWGEFYREITINENLDVSKIKAILKDGVLSIEIPILKILASRRITVELAK
jgi:HSP20 family protein